MARIPAHIIDEIMQTSRIEDVIGEFVHLKRAGSNLKGLSPFTDEKTASFVVSPAKQIFKCFSTGKGGTVVSFLMEKEHYSYVEALKWLANKYSITLPEEREPTADELAAITERESLYIINEFAKTHFMERMNDSEEGKAIGLSYFKERGFRPDIIEKFQLGYCLDSGNDFTKVALEKGYKLEYLEKIGLVKTKENRNFDFFRGRVMFPIHSVTGRVLGFGGRTLLADKKIAKYFNSPESIIYNKSDILYGLYFAKGDIIKYDNCFLVEGYTDVISLNQSGICNVVSSSGTSLTQGQIKLIRRYTQHVTILYDGDAAGIKASFRGIDLLLEEGLQVHVVLFPDGDDPDSYSKKVSTEALLAYIKTNTKDFLTFKAEILLHGEGSKDPLQRVKLIHEIVHSISLIPDQISRSVYEQEIAKRFDIDLTIIQKESLRQQKSQIAKKEGIPKEEIPTNLIPKTEPTPQSAHEITLDEEVHSGYHLIRILVTYGSLAIEVEQKDELGNTQKSNVSVSELICDSMHQDELTFKNSLYNRIFQLISENIENKRFLKSEHFLRLEDQEIVKFVSQISTDDYELSHNWLKEKNIDTNLEIDNLKMATEDAIYKFKLSNVLNRIQEIQQKLGKIDTQQEIEEVTNLLIEQINLEKAKVQIANKLRITIL